MAQPQNQQGQSQSKPARSMRLLAEAMSEHPEVHSLRFCVNSQGTILEIVLPEPPGHALCEEEIERRQTLLEQFQGAALGLDSATTCFFFSPLLIRPGHVIEVSREAGRVDAVGIALQMGGSQLASAIEAEDLRSASGSAKAPAARI